MADAEYFQMHYVRQRQSKTELQRSIWIVVRVLCVCVWACLCMQHKEKLLPLIIPIQMRNGVCIFSFMGKQTNQSHCRFKRHDHNGKYSYLRLARWSTCGGLKEQCGAVHSYTRSRSTQLLGVVVSPWRSPWCNVNGSGGKGNVWF